jgi:hypothetical protein
VVVWYGMVWYGVMINSASRLMQEGEAVQGLHVIRLLQWFIQPAAGTTPEADPYQYISYILTNISQVPSLWAFSPSLHTHTHTHTHTH